MSRTLSGVCAAMSTPTEKARSEPAKTIVLISGRVSICSRAARRSPILGMSMTFRGGLFSTTRATGGCSATVMRVKPVWVPIVMSVPPLTTAGPLGFARGRHFDSVRFAHYAQHDNFLQSGWVVLPIGKTPDIVSLQCIHERVRLVASEGAGLRFGPFALEPPPVSDPRLRFGARRGFQSAAFSARDPRRKISLISRAMSDIFLRGVR